MRPETGPIQFEDDWTGVFIRGDNAFRFLMVCESLDAKNPSSAIGLKELKELLRSCINNNEECLQLKSISDCVRSTDEEKREEKDSGKP